MLQRAAAHIVHRAEAGAFQQWRVAVKQRRDAATRAAGYLQVGCHASAACEAQRVLQPSRSQICTTSRRPRHPLLRSATLLVLASSQLHSSPLSCVAAGKHPQHSQAAPHLQHLMNARLAAAFHGWLAAAEQLAAKHRLVRAAAAHFVNQRLAHSFLAWRAVAQRKLLRAAQLQHAVRHWTSGTLAGAFSAWRAWAETKGAHRARVASEWCCGTSMLLSCWEQGRNEGAAPASECCSGASKLLPCWGQASTAREWCRSISAGIRPAFCGIHPLKWDRPQSWHEEV